MRAISACLLGLTLAVCSACGPEDALLGGGRVTAAGANELLPEQVETVSMLDLLAMIDPDSPKLSQYPKGVVSAEDQPRLDLELHQALAKFADGAAGRPDHGAAKVAMIQDRLLFASDQKCNVFLKYMTRISSYNKTTFGWLSILTGGAGSLINNADISRIFSGVSGMSTGLGAAVEEDFFSNVATSVIGPAIVRARLEYYGVILDKRKTDPSNYSLGEAITDAVRYHGLCTMDTGIAEAARSVQKTTTAQATPDKTKTVKTTTTSSSTTAVKTDAPASLSATIRGQSQQ